MADPDTNPTFKFPTVEHFNDSQFWFYIYIPLLSSLHYTSVSFFHFCYFSFLHCCYSPVLHCCWSPFISVSCLAIFKVKWIIIQENWEKIMANSANVTVVVILMAILLKIQRNMWYLCLMSRLSFLLLDSCQGINATTPKRVVRIRYMCPISNLNNKI